MRKKLKDLKKGDEIWVCRHPQIWKVNVDNVERHGGLCIVAIKWGDEELDCYGPALGWTCIGYYKKSQYEIVFSTDYDELKSVAEKRENEKNIHKSEGL